MQVKWVCKECNSTNICEKTSEMKCFVCGNLRTNEVLIDPKSANPAPPPSKTEVPLDELFDRAWEYAQRGNMEEAVKFYRQAAERGHGTAQNNLGVCYEHGQGVTRDMSEAVRWVRRSAEQGNSVAQCNLGIYLFNGMGVVKNADEAVRWFRRAADQGSAVAQNYLGVCYTRGEGVPRNYSEAVKWYNMAADQGDAYAQNNLSVRYENGEGVPKDLQKALELCRKAAAQGVQEAQTRLPQLEAQWRRYLLDSSAPSDSKAGKKNALYRPENTTAERWLLILGWVLCLLYAFVTLGRSIEMCTSGEFSAIIPLLLMMATYFILPILRRQYCLWDQTTEYWKPTQKLLGGLYEIWVIIAELCAFAMAAFPIPIIAIIIGDDSLGAPMFYFFIGALCFSIYYVGCFIWRRTKKKKLKKL